MCLTRVIVHRLRRRLGVMNLLTSALKLSPKLFKIFESVRNSHFLDHLEYHSFPFRLLKWHSTNIFSFLTDLLICGFVDVLLSLWIVGILMWWHLTYPTKAFEKVWTGCGFSFYAHWTSSFTWLIHYFSYKSFNFFLLCWY